MCWPLRCTVRRGTPSLRMRARVDLARRRRAIFFSMFISSKRIGSASFRRKPESISIHGSGFRPIHGRNDVSLRLLGFLQSDLLSCVAHALALVGFGWTERADLGGGFADALLVGTLDQDFGLRRGFDRHALGRGEHHRMRKTQAEAE